jgi:hypothetical protein
MKNIEITRDDYQSLTESVALFYFHKTRHERFVNLYWVTFRACSTIRDDYQMTIEDDIYYFETPDQLAYLIDELGLTIKLAVEIGNFTAL